MTRLLARASFRSRSTNWLCRWRSAHRADGSDMKTSNESGGSWVRPGERSATTILIGEYGYDLPYFAHMAGSGAVDVLQADVSRCAGITEWLRVAAVAAAHDLAVSAHCAPSLHAHPACAVPNVVHLEYFHDHARVDRLLFDGVLDPNEGMLTPDLTRAGMGLELKRADAERYRRAA
ncbi:MAG: hypothetical protein H0V69_02430 [Acidimicrobiia bacterium]|nr:hypothetical protein [Acidimicrobiia bacterium]